MMRSIRNRTRSLSCSGKDFRRAINAGTIPGLLPSGLRSTSTIMNISNKRDLRFAYSGAAALGLGRVKTFCRRMLELHELVKPAVFATSLCLDGGHQRLNAHDVHDAGEIVGEYVQRHLGGDLGQTLHQEVRRPHPHLQRGKGCSAVSRRWRMACGFLSRRFCTSSSRCSCSPATFACRAASLAHSDALRQRSTSVAFGVKGTLTSREMRDARRLPLHACKPCTEY